MTDTPVCKKLNRWLRLVHGRHVLAPLTGQDASALDTFAHAVELYCHGDLGGRRGAKIAMRGAVSAMQEQTRWLCREAIICISDYGYVEQIWPEIIDSTDQFPDGLEAPIPATAWQEGQPSYMERSA